jgi:hypothetical protein
MGVERRLYVRLHEPEREELDRRARENRRHPSDEAAHLIVRALKERKADAGRE